jgi:hypothetical protein
MLQPKNQAATNMMNSRWPLAYTTSNIFLLAVKSQSAFPHYYH